MDITRWIAAIRRSARRSRPRREGALVFEGLESRMVLSTSPSSAAIRGLQQDLNAAIRAFSATGGAAPDGEPSNVLVQDVRYLGTAYASYETAFLQAAATLKTSHDPSSSFMQVYDSSIATATANLSAAIGPDLANLPNTGARLTATLQANVKALGAQLEADGASLAGATRAGSSSLVREGNSAIATSMEGAVASIFADGASVQVSSATLKNYDTLANKAFATFHASILTAEKVSLKTQTPLSPGAVSQALLTLQSSLISDVPVLGTGLSNSVYNPVPSIVADISKGDSALTSIPRPKLTAIETPTQFQTDVREAAANAEALTSESVVSAVQNFNQGLL